MRLLLRGSLLDHAHIEVRGRGTDCLGDLSSRSTRPSMATTRSTGLK
jgi:hypothetical protein